MAGKKRYSDIDAYFSAALKRERGEIPQGRVAAVSGITLGTISQIERGIRAASLATAVRIARALAADQNRPFADVFLALAGEKNGRRKKISAQEK